MKYRKLGVTGYDVSVLGFGTWQLGGTRWSSGGTAESVRTLEQAKELGINIFDAATVYGQYEDSNGYLQSRSQELLGQAFARCRSEVIYCIKIGQFDEYAHRADYDPARLVAELKQSLRRLRTDYLDICLIHAPTLHEVRAGNALSVLKTMQALGLVRAVGYSFESEPEHARAAFQQPIDVVMLQYNLIDRACNQVIDEACARGIGILAGGPFKRGYLTGKYRAADELPLSDDYWRWNVEKNPAKVEALLCESSTLLSSYGSPEKLRKAALEHILAKEGVASAIVGHRTVEEVGENIAALSLSRPPSRGGLSYIVHKQAQNG